MSKPNAGRHGTTPAFDFAPDWPAFDEVLATLGETLQRHIADPPGNILTLRALQDHLLRSRAIVRQLMQPAAAAVAGDVAAATIEAPVAGSA